MPTPPPVPADSEAVEVAELVDFLQSTPPFDVLDRSLVAYAARHLEIAYARAGTVVLDLDDDTDALGLVRSGAVELHDADGALVARLGEREFFGYPSLLTDSPASRRVTAIEDSLLYRIPEAVFNRLRADSDAFDRFFARAHADRIRDALQDDRRDVPLKTPLRTLLSREPVCAAPSISVQEAARIMTRARVSCLLLCEEADPTSLLGLVTDRDLRTRVVADAVAPTPPSATS